MPPPKLTADDGPALRIERNERGQATRVFVGDTEITHLVVRVGCNTTLRGTTVEVVLTPNTLPPSLGLPQ